MKLKTGSTYLFSYGVLNKEIIEITILEVSKKAYKCQYINGHEAWIKKDEFEDKYKLFEDITKPIGMFDLLPIKIK